MEAAHGARSSAADARKRKILAGGRGRLQKIVSGMAPVSASTEPNDRLNIPKNENNVSEAHEPFGESALLSTQEAPKSSCRSEKDTSDPIAVQPPVMQITRFPESMATIRLENMDSATQPAVVPEPSSIRPTSSSHCHKRLKSYEIMKGAVKHSLGMRLIASIVLAFLIHCSANDTVAYCRPFWSQWEPNQVLWMILLQFSPVILQLWIQALVLACSALFLLISQPQTLIQETQGAGAISPVLQVLQLFAARLIPYVSKSFTVVHIISSVLDVMAVFIVMLGVFSTFSMTNMPA
eukprot:jgi/Botrbrau1/7156/Bobra.0143s0028.1